ncbi:hypothetical protein [Gudongella sp. SC589]|jgi:hypothetical protein|uniref:hypothetical protein n=1 Tax=Gudongella sp. SC589 TaxID=3385990 RepID=UPI003904BAEE
MNKKINYLLLLTIIVGLVLSGCGSSSREMKTMSMEDFSIEDFFPFDQSLLESDFTRKKIEDYLLSINPEVNIQEGHYAIGDLTGDEIPEIAMYIQRDPQDIDDQGSLQIYTYDSTSYVLEDKVPMNYDNTNYILKIGHIAENTKGILLSNQVGSKAGVTYGYVLEDGALKSVLNPKKVNLFSVTTSNSIEDIDGDGILEFSIHSIDPETSADNPSEAATIELWYRWNGRDSAQVVSTADDMVESSMIMAAPRESQPVEAADGFGIMSVPEESEAIQPETMEPSPGTLEYIDYLTQTKDGYSNREMTDRLKEHIVSLKVSKSYRSLDIATMFSKYMKEYSFDSFFEKYGLSQERLNDLEYLQRDRILQSEPDLKEMLIRNRRMGYMLTVEKGRYNYEIDYGMIIDDFGGNLTNEFRKYLRIISKEGSLAHIKDGVLNIPKRELAARIVEIESFRLTFSYSEFLDETLQLYQEYMDSMLYLTGDGKVFNEETGIFQGSSRQELQDIVNDFPDSNMADVINSMLQKVKSSNGAMTPAIRDEISMMIP